MKELQEYVRIVYEQRGYTNELEILGLGLCEEAGEVCAAILDSNPKFVATPDRQKSDLAHELTDCLTYLCAIANATGIDLDRKARENLKRDIMSS